MTILLGEKYYLEGLDQFSERLDASITEIAKALPDDDRRELIEDENEIRKADDEPEVESVEEIRDEHLYELVTARFSSAELIENTLESRDREYVHLLDRGFHTIVEIYPDQR